MKNEVAAPGVRMKLTGSKHGGIDRPDGGLAGLLGSAFFCQAAWMRRHAE